MAHRSWFLALAGLLLVNCAETPRVQTVQVLYQTPRIGEAVTISITPVAAAEGGKPAAEGGKLAAAEEGKAAGEEAGCGRELIVNGGFENPPMVRGNWQRFLAIEGWTLSSGPNIEVQNNVAGSAHSGAQFVELDSDASSSISQSVATRAGEIYELRFAFTAREGTALSDNHLLVVWNGAPVADLAALTVNPEWKTFSFRLKGREAGSRITFEDTGSSDGLGTYLDSVSLRRICR